MHDETEQHDCSKIVSFNWMQPTLGGFLVLDEQGRPAKAYTSYFEMEHDFNIQMRREAGIMPPDNERMPNFVVEPPIAPSATHLTDEVKTQPSRWTLGEGIVKLAARAHR